MPIYLTLILLTVHILPLAVAAMILLSADEMETSMPDVDIVNDDLYHRK